MKIKFYPAKFFTSGDWFGDFLGVQHEGRGGEWFWVSGVRKFFMLWVFK